MGAFNDLIQSDQPVLVDFYADWCQPCHAMTPVIKEVAKAVEGKARVVKVNIDKNQAAAMQFNVSAVPTFIIFRKGRIVWRHAGMTDKNSLLRQLQSV
ncbi:thioredoxin [Chitinophaga sp. GCM10012297]|uniref:Thioredoxin n=1 Tax=Chitinophaga chungangae TaxID=2821488 RepID=A0ABS3YKN0_9BACT|nr:thioredoxin [Chitinophaga chungangae]MBO9155212.1 thioredoxin [Chitinophaga chungangae]